MKRVVAALLLVACADTAETLATAPCLWTQIGQMVVPEGQWCWSMDPPSGMAVTDERANACAADRWQRRSVWKPGQKLKLWQRSWDKDTRPIYPTLVECP